MYKLLEDWDELNEYERRGEWEWLFSNEIGDAHMEFREHLKRIASDEDILNKTPKDYIEKLAIHIVLAYYLRSLESSNYSPLRFFFQRVDLWQRRILIIALCFC